MPAGFAVNPNVAVRAADDARAATRRRRSSAASTARTSSATRSATTTCSAPHAAGRHRRLGGVRAPPRRVGLRAPHRRARPGAARRAGCCRRASARCAARSARRSRSRDLVAPLRGGRRRPDDLRHAGRARNRHEHICESLELFAERGDAGVRRGPRASARRRRPSGSPGAVEAALARREPPRTLDARRT